ncbi:hypothetical protein [Cellulomonas sp. HD19AZ1]|uniref:hypothetical protein n=1 Tax=Cellulomonas sp. HD19AZ1 TaxID=2559593 RepID=UPI00197F080D|nr:hypothetical protein [Cellulomonas sp. HD19AZ1]
MNLVLAARDRPAEAPIWGEEGGAGNNLLDLLTRDDLAAMENPKGRGVLVSVVYAGDGAFARSTAHRTGWLVIDETLYPVNVPAAAAFDLLWDGYPPAVMADAGLQADDYFDFTAYGLEEFVSYNADTASDYSAFLVAANERCEPVSGLHALSTASSSASRNAPSTATCSASPSRSSRTTA